MTTALCQPSQQHPRRQTASRACYVTGREGFSLVELLVVMSIMVLMAGLVGAAVSGARASSKKQQTALLIEKLDVILRQQFSTYASRVIKPPADANEDGKPDLPPGTTMASYRSWYIRRNLMTGDLPDRWSDVKAMHDNTDLFGKPISGVVLFPRSLLTPPQRAYVAIYHGMDPKPDDQYAGAECLFMIVMQGGVANCIDCGELKTAERGDKDGDGAYEFWDAWGNPIGYILWPAALQLPAGTGTPFFSGPRGLEQAFPSNATTPSPSLGMRPLIYSAGPDGEYGFNRVQEKSNLLPGDNTIPVGRNCGNWDTSSPMKDMAVPESSLASDNITNLDAEATQ